MSFNIFDGESDPSEFVRIFKLQALIGRWEEERQKIILSLSLRGEAIYIYESKCKNKSTINEQLDELVRAVTNKLQMRASWRARQSQPAFSSRVPAQRAADFRRRETGRSSASANTWSGSNGFLRAMSGLKSSESAESVVQESVVQESVVQESVVQESVAQESVVQESVAQESVVQESVAQESVVQESSMPESSEPARTICASVASKSVVAKSVASKSAAPKSSFFCRVSAKCFPSFKQTEFVQSGFINQAVAERRTSKIGVRRRPPAKPPDSVTARRVKPSSQPASFGNQSEKQLILMIK